MTGIELIEKMRADDRTCNTPVILLTARSFAIPEEMQQNLRVSSCLSKPFSPKELLKTIQDLLYQPELVAQS